MPSAESAPVAAPVVQPANRRSANIRSKRKVAALFKSDE